MLFQGVKTVVDASNACEDIFCLECWLQLPKCSFCNTQIGGALLHTLH